MKGWAPVLLMLLALPAASAAEPDLTALEVRFVDGAEATGHPVVLTRDAATASTPGFRLSADLLRVETDERSAELFVTSTQASTDVEHHERATLDGVSFGQGARIFVVPAEGAVVALAPPDCSDLLPPPSETRVYAPRVNGRPALEVPLDSAVAWTPCADASVTLHGDLLLVLWAWDARLTSDEGTQLLDSGRGEATDGDVGARERFVFARNATLTLPPARQTVYVEDLRATSDVVRLSGAAGELHGARVDGDLSLSGDVEVLVRGRGVGVPMAVIVGGTVEETLLDGLAFAAPASGWSVAWWPWLLAGAGAVGVVRVRPHLHYLHAERTGGELGSLVPQTLRQRRAVGLWIMARGAEGRRWFRACHHRAARANHLFRPFPEAQFTRAVAAAALGRHADAMTDFIDLYHRYDEPVGRAAAACGMAQQCVRLGKWDGGHEWLRMAADESFRYAHRASLSRDFDHYEGEPWFDALRRGEAGPVLGSSGSRGDPSIQ